NLLQPEIIVIRMAGKAAHLNKIVLAVIGFKVKGPGCIEVQLTIIGVNQHICCMTYSSLAIVQVHLQRVAGSSDLIVAIIEAQEASAQ
ncbi:hypothetical protein OSI40_25435, partial [Mycobacterium ulcerans]